MKAKTNDASISSGRIKASDNKAEGAVTENNSNTPSPKYTTTGQQCQTILKHLAAGNTLTTLFAREHLGICHPGARSLELRQRGYNIVTNYRIEPDVTGRDHRIAECVLFTGSEMAE